MVKWYTFIDYILIYYIQISIPIYFLEGYVIVYKIYTDMVKTKSLITDMVKTKSLIQTRVNLFILKKGQIWRMDQSLTTSDKNKTIINAV